MFKKLLNLIIALMIFGVLFTSIEDSPRVYFEKENPVTVTVNALAGPEAGGIFSSHIFSFEVLSLLLLAALIGSLYIARKEA